MNEIRINSNYAVFDGDKLVATLRRDGLSGLWTVHPRVTMKLFRAKAEPLSERVIEWIQEFIETQEEG